MPARVAPIPNHLCPCQGTKSWQWHNRQKLKPCLFARNARNAQYDREEQRKIKERRAARRALAQDVANMRWITGTPIYMDEEEEAC